MTLLGNFVRTREQEEKRNSWRSISSMRSTSGTASSLMSTLILVSHASFAPFVQNARIISFLSGHAIKISQQSHQSGPIRLAIASLGRMQKQTFEKQPQLYRHLEIRLASSASYA